MSPYEFVGYERWRDSTSLMRTSISAVVILLILGACSQAPRRSASEASASFDSLNARLVQAHRNGDPRADSAVFEWPAFNTVRGRAGLEAMARSNWASLNDMDLELTVSSRRVASDHATEFGAFQQSWRDSNGVRMTEFGCCVVVLGRHSDSWLGHRRNRAPSGACLLSRALRRLCSRTASASPGAVR